jgi:hypothetical protein
VLRHIAFFRWRFCLVFYIVLRRLVGVYALFSDHMSGEDIPLFGSDGMKAC